MQVLEHVMPGLAGPELESGQTASILRMPGHGLSKFCNISHLGMALATLVNLFMLIGQAEEQKFELIQFT